MNKIQIDLSPGQSSKLRNGHSIRISPKMIGSGVDLIIDTMTMNNMFKKLDKGKGIVMGLSKAEIDENKISGTGLFGAGNKSGKISRFKKANKWAGFSENLVNTGMDLGERGLSIFNKQKDRQSPMGQVKRAFGGEMEGGKLSLSGLKKSYNTKIKNSKLGTALRKTTGNILGDVYDKSENKLSKSKYTIPISEYMKDEKTGNVDKLTKLSGVGLRLQGNGMRLSGAGLTMGGKCCGMCGAGMDDKFLFSNQSL
jgi:hypothetical protein